MEIERKVFSSNIIRTQNNTNNNLQDILNLVPASPVVDKFVINSECNFVPKSDKFYIPKKKNGKKVKTVRDIRNVFESDVYSYLPDDLEKQKSVLLRKIRVGSSRDEKTKETAKNMLKSCSPISRSAWQMLMNINPEGHKFPRQYILWNGQYIQVNGSKGGGLKFMHKYDIGKIKETSLHTSTYRKNTLSRKKGLLRNSLNVKFKPGPLTKKKLLDTSYQKHQFGDMELVTLPKPGLDIQPSYGKPLAPVINTFLQNAFVLNSNGIISQKWADFAVSVLGTNKNGIPFQLKDNCNVTFNLEYKCFQHRLLMRNDIEIIHHEKVNRIPIQTMEKDSIIESEVSDVLDKIIDSVEISLKQNVMFFREDETREVFTTNTSINSNHIIKDKGKRKYGELDRLDVTVIRISDVPEANTKNTCCNTYCTLGCICDSLKYSYGLKTHCSRVECMFQCKCDFSKYKFKDSFDNDCSDIIPGLVNLDKKLGQTLSKEEQKFHQTVIVTNEKSILLKSRKRNWKASKKFADFYSNMRLKTECGTKQTVTVLCTNLKLKNVEPWCMVHNLYKCFCKGKFTESLSSGVDELINTCNKISEKNKKLVDNIDLTLDEKTDKNNLNTQEDLGLNYKFTRKRSIRDNNESSINSLDYKNSKCARTFPYKHRKYNDEYYQSTNKRILEMERNDKTLTKKLLSFINKDDQENNILHNINNPDVIDPPSNVQENNVLHNINNPDVIDPPSNVLLSNLIEQTPLEFKDVKKLSSKKLVTWLESNYKQYKEKASQGLIKHTLHPPRPGTMALYPWDFILSRYRERKNHFLISKQQPFRIFMAVDTKNSLFDNYININDIALSDLDKYPVTVKNLLTNATDLKDNFCILCGLLHCWELVGSVTKVNNDRENAAQGIEINRFIAQREKSLSDCSSDLEFSPNFTENSSDDLNNSLDDVVSQVSEKYTEQSKWFVMTVENDFTEIRFYKKGFFVKYDSIMKAINVAKLSGKTVKLSSQNCSNLQNSPNFGIYAIPSDTDNYVFIGPYEKDEALGIETIKTLHDIKKSKNTRGTWITTNKIDNLKVIDNPLSYMPLLNTNSNNILNLEDDSSLKIESSSSSVSQVANKEVVGKVVKPIKIRKTNGFYQLAPNGLLQQVPLSKKDNLKYSQAMLAKKSLLINKNVSRPNVPLLNSALVFRQDSNEQKVQTEKKIALQCQKPVAEIAPQIKECNNADLANEAWKRKLEGSMFVLKPEEINKRSFENQLLCNQQQTLQESTNMDIENFLESSVVCVPPKHEYYVISDEEDDNINNQCTKDDTCKDVWIVCKNIDSLGWIPGRRNSVNHLSFEFPGFKYSEFYNESEAFNKITQVLSRKIYIPRHINLDWQVLETIPDSNIKKKLEAKDLCTDYMDEFVPTKRKKSWNPENMKTALEAIRNGSKIKTAAKNFDVPESTIRDRLKLGDDYNPPMGRKATFSKEEEKEMVAFITQMAKNFYGITQQQLRKLAYDFAVAKNIKNFFSSETGMAGTCWVYSFLKRNPGISLRLPEPTNLNRVLGFNKSEVTIFFANLETLMSKHNFPANRIFNVDETGVSSFQKSGKIYGPTGLKQVGKATSAEHAHNVTVVCALSATGIYVPPMFIFPMQRVNASLRIGGPPGAIYECSKSGWINEELFAKWLQHFATNIDAHAQNPALLILDNNSSHQSLSAFEFCRENGIHVLSLPPHTSHKIQPLDVTFYGPLKSAYSRECDLYLKMHPYEKITYDHFPSIFKKAYTRVATTEKAVKGFEVTGIYPLNPHIFDDNDILSSDPITEEMLPSGPVHLSDGFVNALIRPIIDHDESTRTLVPSPSILTTTSPKI